MASEIGNWICCRCGLLYGRKSMGEHIMTVHVGRCDYCGTKDVPVTSPRDYGYPMLPERPGK